MNDDEAKVFRHTGADWYNRAMLMHGCGDRWVVYAEGYKEAADRLVIGIESGAHYQDFLVYPILFLYRHFLEVAIKGHIRACQKLLGICPPKRPKREDKAQMAAAAQGHDLESLWAYLLDRVYQLHPQQAPEVMDQATRVIAAFHQHDAGGDAARYPVGLGGAVNLSGLSEVNLRQLREDMVLAAEAITQIDGIIDYEMDLDQAGSDALGLDG